MYELRGRPQRAERIRGLGDSGREWSGWPSEETGKLTESKDGQRTRTTSKLAEFSRARAHRELASKRSSSIQPQFRASAGPERPQFRSGNRGTPHGNRLSHESWGFADQAESPW